MSIISIIVPVYNVAPYIKRCAESLRSQTFFDIEIIFIDDGSTDGSAEICDAYALEDSRIKVIHQANAGVSSARNVGIQVAKGEFIGFVDADDFIDKKMYEELYKVMQACGADISCCDLAFFDGEKITESGKTGEVAVLNGEQTFAKMLDTSAYLRMGVWNKLYRREIIGDIQFEVGRHMSEDLLFLIETVLEVEKVAYIQKPLYFYYRQREGAATRKKYGNYEKQRIESTQKLVDVVRNRHGSILEEAILYKCINGDLTAFNKMIAADVVDRDTIIYVKNDLKKEIRSVLSSRISLAKKAQILLATYSFSLYRIFYQITNK